VRRNYDPRTVNVLFVCEDNSALSIMAESILNSVAPGRFHAYSAGCAPRGTLDEHALELLSAHNLSVERAQAKSLEQLRASATRMDFVITLCDAAAAEPFAEWPGEPFVAHWNVEERELRDSFWTLMRRINIFASLPQGKLSRRALERRARTLEAGYH